MLRRSMALGHAVTRPFADNAMVWIGAGDAVLLTTAARWAQEVER